MLPNWDEKTDAANKRAFQMRVHRPVTWLTVSASPLAKSWADAFTTRAAAHAGAASARFCAYLSAFVWCGDQRELLIKIGAMTGFADRRIARANEGLKLFAASAAAISKDRHDCPKRMFNWHMP